MRVPAWRGIALCLLALTAAPVAASAQPRMQGRDAPADLGVELVDPNVLRVCADPHNLPFANEKGEGFENKIAELFADKLHKSLDYAFFPQATGFVRVTLGAHRCDVIIGFPQGNDLVQGMQQALSGLEAIPVKPAELLEALGGGGAPCTVEQIQTRFGEFVTKITRGKEPSKVRLVIDRGENPGGQP